MPLPVEEFRVLVVDADASAADQLADSLRTYGFSVRAVTISDAALMLAERFRPHALISEISMPGLNGIDLSNHFAERFPECKILLTSCAASIIETLEYAIPRSVITFMRKPLQIYEVLQFLAACLPAS